MALDVRNGRLRWRFTLSGHTYGEVTDLEDTPKNRNKALMLEAAARKLATEGRSDEIRLKAIPFSKGVEQYIEWAKGEYAEHPNSWKRLRGSLGSATSLWEKRSFASIGPGDLEDYKTARRTMDEVQEVTLRHDLHALSLLFQYGKRQSWCRRNPVEGVEVPSDKGAVRMLVLSAGQEAHFFGTVDSMIACAVKEKDTRKARGLGNIRDLAWLILHQGCRPGEFIAMPKERVTLMSADGFPFGSFAAKGKSEAAKRRLPISRFTQPVFTRRMDDPSPWLFPSEREAGAKHIGSTQRQWEAVRSEVGIEDLVLYSFRHTFATRAIENGTMTLPELIAVIGHADLRTIMKYVHMRQQNINRAMARNDEFGTRSGQDRDKKGHISPDYEISGSSVN